LRVPQLKELLKARGLKVSGKKSELIQRLITGSNLSETEQVILFEIMREIYFF
jgi:hypothetical protein